MRSALCVLWVLCCFPPPGPLRAQDDPKPDKEIIKKCYEAARRSVVGLEIHLRKPSRLERRQEPDELTPEEQEVAGLAENQQTLDTYGVVVDKDGTILMPDRRLKPEQVEKIVAHAADGTSFEVRLHALGRNYDCVALKPVDLRKPLEPVAFEEFKRFELGSFFYVVYADRVDREWHLNVSPWIVTNAPLQDEKSWMLIDQVRRGAVLFDGKGRPVGIPYDQYLWIRGARDSFVGRGILADERLPFADLEKRTADIERALVAGARHVEAILREDKQTDFYDADAKSLKLSLFGFPTDEKGTFLVPFDLGGDLVRRFEELRGPDGKPTAFVGSFKGFGALLLRGAPAKPVHRDDVAQLDPGALCWTASIEERFGRVSAKVEPNRALRIEKGMRGVFKQEFRWRARLGSFVLDFEGRPIGIYTNDRKEEDIEEAAMEASRERYYGVDRYRQLRPSHLRRIYMFADLKAVLADPAPHFDPRAIPMTTKKEKTLVWIGVEFQEVSKALAESLGVEDKDLTNEGKRGLLVTLVYPDSPATKAGLRPDDILLSVKPDGEAKATELAPEPDRWGPHGFGGTGRPGAVPWLPRKNYLTAMLTEIGAGRKVAVEFLRGREKASVAIALEEGPTDYDTAEKMKDDGLGLTVKDLTYEVRHFQKMGRADTGVVVAKIESGSRAEVGKLQTLSIITRVNDAPVRDVAQFKAQLDRHRASNARSVTLMVLSYGQTRLVDVELGAKE